RSHILDDEDLLAWLDQPQLPARDFLDGVRIAAQAPRFLTQAGVLGALPRDGRGQHVALVARAKHRQQPTIPDEAVDDDNRGDEHDHPVNDAAVSSRGTFWFRWTAFDGRSTVDFHLTQTVQQPR